MWLFRRGSVKELCDDAVGNPDAARFRDGALDSARLVQDSARSLLLLDHVVFGMHGKSRASDCTVHAPLSAVMLLRGGGAVGCLPVCVC